MLSSIHTSILSLIIIFASNLFQYNAAGLPNKSSYCPRYDLKFHLYDTSGWKWADSLDAVRAAPNSHKVLFENEKIRILEVTVDPHGFEPMHTHRYPGVMFGPDNDSARYDIIYYRYDYDSAKHVYFAKDSMLQHGGGQTVQPNKAHVMNPEGPTESRISATRGFLLSGLSLSSKSS